MKAPNFKSMSLDELMSMRDQIDQEISARRSELATQMARLDRFNAEKIVGSGVPRKRGPLPPKYCNPKDPRETWAGRGRLPRWMSAALENGKKMEDFRIERVLGAKKGRSRRKTWRID